MELTLQNSNIKDIHKLGAYLFYFTAAGVDIFLAADGTTVGFATLANTTCGAVNNNGVYLGTSDAGVYRLATVTTGDMTASLVQTYTTTSTPAIQSNAINSLAAFDLFLAIGHAAGLDYVKQDLTTMYSMTVTGGCWGLDMDSSRISFAALDNAYSVARPVGNWQLEGAVKLVNMKSSESVSSVSFTWSPALATDIDAVAVYGAYVAITTTTALVIYKLSGTTLTRLYVGVSTGNAKGLGWDDTGTYLAYGTAGSPYMSIVKRTGDTFAALTCPTLPNSGLGFAWQGNYLAVICSNTSGNRLFLMQVLDTTVTNLFSVNYGTTAYMGDVMWFGDFLVVAISASPYILTYLRVGDTLVAQAAVPSPGFNAVRVCKVGDRHLFMIGSGTNVNLFYKVVDNALVKLSNPPFRNSNANSATPFAWGDYIFVSLGASPWVQVLLRSGDTLVDISGQFNFLWTQYCRSHAVVGGYILSAGPYTPYVRPFTLNYTEASKLGTTVTRTALGEDVFVATDAGIQVFDSQARCVKNITDALGAVKDVKSVAVQSNTSMSQGLLAYGVDDGLGGGKFGMLDMAQV